MEKFILNARSKQLQETANSSEFNEKSTIISEKHAEKPQNKSNFVRPSGKCHRQRTFIKSESQSSFERKINNRARRNSMLSVTSLTPAALMHDYHLHQKKYQKGKERQLQQRSIQNFEDADSNFQNIRNDEVVQNKNNQVSTNSTSFNGFEDLGKLKHYDATDVKVFASNVTMHGIYHVFASHHFPIRRFVWSLFFLAALNSFIYLVMKSIVVYKARPHFTAIEESSTSNKSLVFPQVTICNVNSYKWRMFTPSDLINSRYVTGLVEPVLLKNPEFSDFDNDADNFTVPEFIESGKFKLKAPKFDENSYLVGHLKVLLSYYNNFGNTENSFNMWEFTNRTGHQLNDMLLYCRYRGLACSDHGMTIKPIFTRFGKCYTFNAYYSWDGDRFPVESLKGGVDNGLEILLDVQQDEYMPVWEETDEVSTEMGFKIEIHDHDEPPMITEMGFGVSPGFQTLASTSEQRFGFLPEPWGECLLNEAGWEFDHIWPKFSISACRTACEANFIIKNCNCKMVHMPQHLNGTVPYCSPYSYKTCADPALDYSALKMVQNMIPSGHKKILILQHTVSSQSRPTHLQPLSNALFCKKIQREH